MKGEENEKDYFYDIMYFYLLFFMCSYFCYTLDHSAR